MTAHAQSILTTRKMQAQPRRSQVSRINHSMGRGNYGPGKGLRGDKVALSAQPQRATRVPVIR